MEDIRNRVHGLYWDHDINCARTMLVCLGERFGIKPGRQTMAAAVGLHGAGGYRAQCGLVEGGLMFIGIYCLALGRTDDEAATACYQYADAFHRRFGSLTCHDLRPTGFRSDDPPHLCEGLTCAAVAFTDEYIRGHV